MIQLDNKKKIIILGATVAIVIIAIIFLLVIKNKKPVAGTPVNNGQTVTNTVQTTRDMTRQEKIDHHIDPNQAVEVIKDQDGLYLYRIKK